MAVVNDSVKVSISAKDIKKQFNEQDIQKSVDKYIKTCLRESCLLISNYAKKHHRYKDKTGKLTRALKFNVIRKANRYVSNVYIDTKDLSAKQAHEPYSTFQIGGTGIYNKNRRTRIVPHNAKFLKFHSRMYGKTFYLRSAKGIPTDNYLDKAFEKMQPNVQRIFDQELERLLKG